MDISLRIARRGLLNLSVITSFVIAFTLWVFQAGIEEAQKPDNSQVAAAALLVVPALLVVFAWRPEEHAWASRLLIGVRALMLGSGLLAAAAAAALAGVRLQGTASGAFILYATLASVIAALLGLAWLTSWAPARRWVEAEMTAIDLLAATGIISLVLAGVCALTWLDVTTFAHDALAREIVGGLALAVALPCVAVGAAAPRGRVSVWPRLGPLLAAIAAAAVLVATVGPVEAAVGSTLWPVLAIACSASALGGFGAAIVVARRSSAGS